VAVADAGGVFDVSTVPDGGTLTLGGTLPLGVTLPDAATLGLAMSLPAAVTFPVASATVARDAEVLDATSEAKTACAGTSIPAASIVRTAPPATSRATTDDANRSATPYAPFVLDFRALPIVSANVTNSLGIITMVVVFCSAPTSVIICMRRNSSASGFLVMMSDASASF
jgi:hypothetical protein